MICFYYLKFIVYSYFLIFPTSVPELHPGFHINSSCGHVSWCSFWLWHCFILSFLWWPQFWGMLIRYILGCSFSKICLISFFFKIRLGLCLLGKKTAEVNYSFYHSILSIYAINMAYEYWCWPWSSGRSRIYQGSQLYVKVLFPPPSSFYTIFFRNDISMHSPYDWELCLSSSGVE